LLRLVSNPLLTRLGLESPEIETTIPTLSILEQERAIDQEGTQVKVPIAHPLALQTPGLLSEENLVEMKDVMTDVMNEEMTDEMIVVKRLIHTFLPPALVTNNAAALLPPDADLELPLHHETVQTSSQIAPGPHLVDIPLEEMIVIGHGLR
jgi:hypothetical protein